MNILKLTVLGILNGLLISVSAQFVGPCKVADLPAVIQES